MNPGKFDCWSKAEPDEPTFTLLGRDPLAKSLVDAWALVREKTGEDPEKVEEARQCADAMEAWARKLGKKPLKDEQLSALLIEQRQQTISMIKGLVRFAELREQDEPSGKIWDDESREALDVARELGWGKDRTGRLP